MTKMLQRIAQSCFKFVVSELHAEAVVDGLGKNYANLQAVVKICQFSVSKLSTVIDSTNQNLIPGAGIMEQRHQWNVYRLPRVPFASLTESRSSLAEFFFQTSLGACSQARKKDKKVVRAIPIGWPGLIGKCCSIFVGYSH